MKKRLAIFLCIALILSSFGLVNAFADESKANLSLVTTGTDFNPGAIIPVQVKLSGTTVNSTGVDSLEVIIKYDTRVFNFDEQGTANWIDAKYISHGLNDLVTPFENGFIVQTWGDGLLKIWWYDPVLPAVPLSVDGTLFTLNCYVLPNAKVGPNSLNLLDGDGAASGTFVAFDKVGNPIDNTTQDLSFTIAAPTEAPTETPTEAPTETSTEAPTEVSTQAPIVNVPMAQSQITTTLVGENLTIAVDNASTNYKYQFWCLQKVSQDLVDSSNIALFNWVKVADFSATSTASFSSANTTDANGNYQIMVRVIKTDGTFVGQFIDIVTQVDAGVVGISTVLVNGKATTGNEYFKKTHGTISFKINALHAVGYSLAGCNAVPGNDGLFTLNISAYEPGRYSLRAIALGSSTTAEKAISLNIYGADATESYPVVTGLSAQQGAQPQNIVVNASGSAVAGTQYMFMLSEPNRSAIQNGGYVNDNSKTFSLSSQAYGKYLLSAFARRSSATNYDDGMITTYNFARPGAPVTVDAVVTGSADFNNVTLGQTINFVATGIIPGILNDETVQYSFWRNDANGFTLFKDWATGAGANTLTWKPSKAGNYSIQIRVKGSVAGSYEAVKSFSFKVDGANMSTLPASDITVKFYDVSTGAEIVGNLPARTPVEVRATVPAGNNLYYKYIVYDAQLGGYQISSYSPDNTVIWTPRKATSFSVSVFARSYSSFGTADVIKTVNVTAQ